jgi:hypothetical protein
LELIRFPRVGSFKPRCFQALERPDFTAIGLAGQGEGKTREREKNGADAQGHLFAAKMR